MLCRAPARFHSHSSLSLSRFGALWWWIDSTNEPFLIDFNPRAERHQCLVSVVDSFSQSQDPCYVFQQVVHGSWNPHPDDVLPYMAAAGIKYLDPIRVVRTAKREYFEMLLGGVVQWNLQRDDAPLEGLIQEMVALHFKNVSAASARASEKQPKRKAVVGWTPLLAACRAGNLKIVTYLLDHGATLGRDHDGTTCLHLAAESGNLDLVRLLVEKGLDVDAVRDEGGLAPDRRG